MVGMSLAALFPAPAGGVRLVSERSWLARPSVEPSSSLVVA